MLYIIIIHFIIHKFEVWMYVLASISLRLICENFYLKSSIKGLFFSFLPSFSSFLSLSILNNTFFLESSFLGFFTIAFFNWALVSVTLHILLCRVLSRLRIFFSSCSVLPNYFKFIIASFYFFFISSIPFSRDRSLEWTSSYLKIYLECRKPVSSEFFISLKIGDLPILGSLFFFS